jgi:hypothetical protein
MAPIAKPSQKFVPIKEVRDGIIILKDGGLRAVMMCSSINLALKAYDEQKATIAQFQSFLNSLDFSVQIVIQSRRYDIRPYLLTLEQRMKDQTEPLLKMQTREYIDFIREFTDTVNIMRKYFFVVVPYTQAPLANKSGGFIEGLIPGNKSKPKKGQSADDVAFEEKRSQLDQRIGVIQQGLARSGGIQAVQLGTEEVVELFYKVFNPGETEQNVKIEQTS